MNPRCPLPLSEIERQLSTPLAPTALPCFYSLSSSVQIADKACYKLGSIYGMDLASGLSVHVLDVRPEHSVLDLCAAPGNKLAMIADAMRGGAEAVSGAAAASSAAASSSSLAAAASPASASASASGSVVGVDWSYARLAATRTLLRKYKRSAAHVQLYLADGQTFERPRRIPQQIRTGAAASAASRRATDIQIVDLTHQPRPACSAAAAIASPASFHVAGSADSSVWRVPPAAASSPSTGAPSPSAAAAASAPVVLRVSKREKRAMTKQHKRAEWEKKRKRDEGLDAEDSTAAAAECETTQTESKEPDPATTEASLPTPSGPDLYDRVLVDAECTHDGAHKHMLSIAQAEAREAASASASSGSAAAAASSSASPSSSTPSSAATWSAFATRYFSSAHLSSLQVLQRALLLNGFRLLRSGGILVYSTCSFMRRQNEEIVEWLLAQEPTARALQVWKGVEDAGAVERIAEAATAEDKLNDTTAAGLFRVSLRSDLPALTFRVAPNPDASSSAAPLGIRLSPWTSGTSGLFIAKITKLAG